MRGVLAAMLVSFLATVYAKNNNYVFNEETGISYRIVYQSRHWAEAKKTCEREGAKLAVPKSQEEFNFIQRLVRGMHLQRITGSEYKLLVYIGINNLKDFRVWKNVDGENIKDTGFHTWAEGNGVTHSDNPAEPRCAGLDAINPGLRDWWCLRSQPFVCQKNSPSSSGQTTKINNVHPF